MTSPLWAPTVMQFPENLELLHQAENELREKSVALIEGDLHRLQHVGVVECTMDMLDLLRQHPTQDEDFKVVQMLALRSFNSFASSSTLLFRGYYQTGALIMRDILETAFLLSLFRGDRSAITRWRICTPKERRKTFGPVEVRKELDKRDGFTEKKRAARYEMFSELAAHPTMASAAMLRPNGLDARNGPFVDPSALDACLVELAMLAIELGESIAAFAPPKWHGMLSVDTFNAHKRDWLAACYGQTTRTSP